MKWTRTQLQCHLVVEVGLFCAGCKLNKGAGIAILVFNISIRAQEINLVELHCNDQARGE